MKKILITGGLGYLGGRISQHLSESTDIHLRLGTRDTSKYTRPDWLKQGEMVDVDLFSNTKLEKLCADTDIIVHLAALNEIDSGKWPDKAIRVNTEGSINLLMAAKKMGVRRFIYFSTAHVYGSPLTGTLSEETLPRAAHPYSISHKAMEDFVLAAHDRNEIEGVVIRLSNGFGVPERAEVDRWTLLVNDLCKQAVVTKKLVLLSAGLQLRDFITLHDVARGVQHFIHMPAQDLGDGIYNLGGEKSVSIIDMTRLVADRCEVTLGYRPEIICPDIRPNEVSGVLNYSIDKIKATGFSLAGSFAKEVDATLKLCAVNFGH